MADTGWVLANAGANVDNGGAVAWSNPGNVTADDGTNATVAPDVGDPTDYLRATFNLSALIPVGATINGVEARYQALRSASGPTEQHVYLVVGGTAVGADKSEAAAYTGVATDYTRGGAADLWSTTITRDQAVATDFGFQFSVIDNDSGTETTSCDVMWIKVYFTESGGSSAGSFFFGGR